MNRLLAPPHETLREKECKCISQDVKLFSWLNINCLESKVEKRREKYSLLRIRIWLSTDKNWFKSFLVLGKVYVVEIVLSFRCSQTFYESVMIWPKSSTASLRRSLGRSLWSIKIDCVVMRTTLEEGSRAVFPKHLHQNTDRYILSRVGLIIFLYLITWWWSWTEYN